MTSLYKRVWGGWNVGCDTRQSVTSYSLEESFSILTPEAIRVPQSRQLTHWHRRVNFDGILTYSVPSGQFSTEINPTIKSKHC